MMYIIKNKLFAFILVLFFGTSVFSQVKINEYSCANVSGLTDAFGGTPDWFELYNASISPKNIQGYYVSNDVNNIGKWQFPINTTIPAKGFLVVFASGLDTVTTGVPKEYHTNFNLLQTKGEKIILANASGTILDSITIRRHQHNHSWALVPDGGITWKVFARDPMFSSPTATPGATNVGKSYLGYLPNPVFSLNGGFYSGGVQVTLSMPSSSIVTLYNPSIYYAGGNAFYSGADPSITGTTKRKLFSSGTPIYVDSSTVIRAYLDTSSTLGNAAYLPSFIETHSFFINGANALSATNNSKVNTNFTLPVVSLAFDTLAVGAFPSNPSFSPQYYTVSMEYFDKNKNFKFQTVGAAFNPSADDAMPSMLGGIDYSAEDEYGYNYTNKQQFYTDASLASSTRTEQTNITFRATADDKFPFALNPATPSFPTHMRDAMAQTYALKNSYNVDGSRYQPCIMYLNGKYWGVYEIRETFDAEYLEHYYAVDATKAEVLLKDGASFQGIPSPTAQADWGKTVRFITTNNMANDTLLAKADSMLDFKSLIDLLIYNSYAVNGEFPKKSAWWRVADPINKSVKWRYHLFDMDDVYGLNKNNSGLVSTQSNASNCQYRDQFGAITDSSMATLAIFKSLMVSDSFRSQFINRYSYLLNTTLQCAPIIAHLTYVRNLLSPEMNQHCARWSFGIANDTVWNIGVDTMKYWINQRCLGLRNDIKMCYNVTGPYDFCTEIFPPGTGSITLNTLNYPVDHTESYLANVNFDAIAIPDSNYYFDHWEPTGFTLPASILKNDSIQWLFTTTSCLKAVFKLKEPYNVAGEPLVPSGFSPNGDGNNDVLNVYGTLQATAFSLEVYDRWGERLFSSTEKTKGWDGRYGGSEAPVGVYAYTFRVVIDGKVTQKSGSVTLIR